MNLPVEGDNAPARISLARQALCLVQPDEETGDVPVNGFNFRELRKNARHAFFQLVPRFGQLLDALVESDAFIQLEPSDCGPQAGFDSRLAP